MTAPAHTGPMLYNPALLSREDLIATFVVRHAELDELLERVRSAPADHAPQHVLILGWRGMGKTTLLHRLAYAVEDDPALRGGWLPVLFDEEQLNVGELADFWLNALEMLAVAADDRSIQERTEELAAKLRGRELEEAAYELLAASAQRLGKRLLLLVDNVDLVLARIEPDREASRLREVLQHEPWLMLVGTSSQAIEATYDYGQPFYEMFRIIELCPLDEGQTLETLARLAKEFNAPDVAQVIREDDEKIRKLRLLMGGNPRTIGLLFGVLQEGPTTDFRSELERLLDSTTSLYKDRLESLPLQTQRVFVALAQRWDPVSAADVARDLRIGRGVASGQLHRLVERGLVEKVRLPSRAIGFQVRERFFNLWWLMRGGRRSRGRLRWLVEAIDIFYDSQRVANEIQRITRELASSIDLLRSPRHIEYGAALMRVATTGVDRVALVFALRRALASLPPTDRPLDSDARELLELQNEMSADDAVAFARQSIDAGFIELSTFRSVVWLLVRDGRWDDLLTLSKRYLEHAEEAFAWQAVAIAHFFMLDMSASRTAALAGLALAPEDPLTWEVLANVEFFSFYYEAAKEKIVAGLEVAPRDFSLNLSAGLAMMKPDLSVILHDSVDEERPILPLAYVGASLLLLALSEDEDRLKVWLMAIDDATRNWPASYFMTVPVLYIARGCREIVVEVLEKGRLASVAEILNLILAKSDPASAEGELAPEKVTVIAHWLQLIEGLGPIFVEARRRAAAPLKTATAPTPPTPAPAS